ncbi:MAG: aspartate aminotransferase family protein [Chlorobi bacterium]|nr:aspartate aminotransferase family protein [Chlorobiota bacterium]
MISQRQLFLQYLAQTSESPIQLEVEKAEGIYLFDPKGKKYIDLISGISVSNVGHRHPNVLKAIQNQLDKYLHLMVYGEYIQSPQVKLAKLLAANLPPKLNNTYFVNSGSEAIEVALKLAKRFTGKSEIIAFKNAYHGSTAGALSILGDESFKRSFRPLLPDIKFLNFNNFDELKKISKKTSCVIIEPIQAEAGVILPKVNYLNELRKQCTNNHALLVFDEVQTGFGRTGSLFAFEQYKTIPDVLVIAKGIAGGMPLGAVISSKEILDSFKTNPMLGHITTFGGHPVSCAAGIATLNTLLNDNLIKLVNQKSELFKKLLKHKLIKEVRGKGLLLAVELTNKSILHRVIQNAMKKGIIIDWFLFNNAFRIAPPLIITEEEIQIACNSIIESLNEV